MQKIRTITLCLVLVGSLFAAQLIYAAPDTPNDRASAQRAPDGDVYGTVYWGRVPLAGVEVWVGEFSGGSLVKSHYACTNSYGQFKVSGVTLDTDLMSAVGIEVYEPQPCSNPLFLDPSAGIPLLIQYWDHRSGVGPADIFRLTSTDYAIKLTYNVERWPIDAFPGLVTTLTASITQFHSGNTALAVSLTERFIFQVGLLEGSGALTAAEAAQLVAYAQHLISVVYPTLP